ncbi:MAG: hypothetical protein ACYDBQ_00205 [Thermoplasmatota archaeon]
MVSVSPGPEYPPFGIPSDVWDRLMSKAGSDTDLQAVVRALLDVNVHVTEWMSYAAFDKDPLLAWCEGGPAPCGSYWEEYRTLQGATGGAAYGSDVEDGDTPAERVERMVREAGTVTSNVVGRSEATVERVSAVVGKVARAGEELLSADWNAIRKMAAPTPRRDSLPDNVLAALHVQAERNLSVRRDAVENLLADLSHELNKMWDRANKKLARYMPPIAMAPGQQAVPCQVGVTTDGRGHSRLFIFHDFDGDHGTNDVVGRVAKLDTDELQDRRLLHEPPPRPLAHVHADLALA